MATSKIYNFNTISDYDYNSDLVSLNPARLKLQQGDCWATYTNNINLNYGSGVLTGVPIGGASVSNNRLDLAHNDIRYVDYEANGNADSRQTGCVRLKFTPNYSGSPSDNQYFFMISQGNGSANNFIGVFHDSGTGNITVTILDLNGNVITNTSFGNWNPVLGTTYEVELNWDITTGATRLFIDGNIFGGIIVSTGTRSAAIERFRIGSNNSGTLKSNAFFEDVVVFDVVQHTSNYTPGYTLAESKYSKTNPLLKLKTALNIDSILSLTMSYSETGSDQIKMIADIDGIDYYWNGSSWAVSSGYSESNSYTEFRNNISTLLSDRSNFKFGLYFHSDDGSTTPSVSSLTLLYNVIAVAVGTNSWVSLDDANTYMNNRFNNSVWESSTEINIKKSIITAFKWLYNSQKFNIPLTATAQIVKDAQTELANYILVNFEEFEKRRALQTQGVESFHVLKWQEKFIKSADIPEFINDMLIDYIQNKGGVFFSVSRNLSGNRT